MQKTQIIQLKVFWLNVLLQVSASFFMFPFLVKGYDGLVESRHQWPNSAT